MFMYAIFWFVFAIYLIFLKYIYVSAMCFCSCRAFEVSHLLYVERFNQDVAIEKKAAS